MACNDAKLATSAHFMACQERSNPKLLLSVSDTRVLKVRSSIAAVVALLAFASAAFAGTLNVTSGPTFSPPAAFTDNTIKVETLHNPPGVTGDVVKLSGSATVVPPPSNSATVEVSGNYTANPGDAISAAYSFTINSSGSRPVSYTVQGSATVLGSPANFNKTDTVLPGLHQYRGTVQLPISFPFAASGTFTTSFTLNFGSSASASNAPASPAVADSLVLRIDQANVQLAPTAATLPPHCRALNIATRLAVANGANVLIGGFIITGNDPKKVIIRGLGPTIQGVSGILADPTLELHQGSATLIVNDNWKTRSDGTSQQSEVEATTIPPSNDLESAIVTTLSPGSYTAILAGKNGGTGVGLVEIYDLAQGADSQLANISTRGLVQTGNDVMIGGFILGPNSNDASSIVIRAIGPSLTAFGIADALPDPTIELRGENGVLIASNDNWMECPDKQTIIDKGLAPGNDKESALLAIPAPGNYTAIVRDANNVSGVGVVEAYNLQ